jgi:hypothetical protein
VRVADLPIRQRLGGACQRPAVQRSGDPDPLVGVGPAHAGAVAQPAGGGLGGHPLVGAGGAPTIHPCQLAQPVAFQPLDEPAQHQHPLGRFRVGHAGEVLGGQFLDHRG